ncbi:MAG: DegV family protein [Lachnospiraceae bacterium]|nr:DegV family protein [Lachnospiraceae bacterium]
MSIKIVTDSASDILPNEAKEMGISVIPLTLNWDGNDYKDAIDMDHEEFFKKLESSESIPVTSQVSPMTFIESFGELLKDNDKLIMIALSSKLSGTYQSACIAAEEYPGKVFVIDSLSATVGQRLLVIKAINYLKEGLSIEETVNNLKEDRYRIRIIAKLDTLKYLKKGGRISATAAFAGEMLSIKPVITVTDGAIALVGKARGSKNADNLLRKTIAEVGGVDFSNPCALVYSGLSDDQLQQYIEGSRDIWQDKIDKFSISTIGAVIGTHIGPGAIGAAFFENIR